MAKISLRVPVDRQQLQQLICQGACLSHVFETGQGTCAPMCMDQLGDARVPGCRHVVTVHSRLADKIIEVLCK